MSYVWNKIEEGVLRVMGHLIKDEKVEFTDPDHVWIGGRQFISLERFMYLQKKDMIELQNYMDKIEQLTKENEAMRILFNVQEVNHE